VRLDLPLIGRELADDDLQHVVGGLARTWLDDAVLIDRRDLVPREGE
jgi:hypothetical protein